MATSKCYYQRPSHRFISAEQAFATGSDFEFDEWDLYNQGPAPPEPSGFGLTDFSSTAGRTGTGRNRFASETIIGTGPVNVPDWSKILGEESHRRRVVEVGDDVSGGGERMLPPHEFLAKRRMASLSVHEGAGRTLKGRDLSRVRNAIFEITGFQD